MLKEVLDNNLVVQITERLAGETPGKCVTLNGVWGSAQSLLAACIGKKTGKPVMLLTHHLDDADAAADDIEIFLSTLSDNESGVHQFPAWEARLSGDRVSDEITGERLRLLDLLANPQTADEEVRFIVAPMMAMLQPVPTKEALAAGHLKLRCGMEMSIDSLMAWLTDGGYERADQVDQQGQCAHRGGIVDIFSPGVQTALRVEFWGDTIESIRKFDLDTQRSTETLQAFDVPSMAVGQCRAGDDFTATNFLEYLPDDTIIILPEPAELRDLANQLYDRVRDDLVEESSPVALRKTSEVFAAISRFTRVEMHLFGGKSNTDAIRMGVRSLERLSINTGEALGELEEIAAVNNVWIFCENDAERQRLTETLNEHYPLLAKRVHFGQGHISTGFHWPASNLAAVGHAEIYQRYSHIRRIRRVRAGRPIESMLDLNEGDYVVHVAHGIARFEGLRKHERDDAGEEYLKLKFANGAVLNVPAAQINLVQKYIGAKGHRPTLSTLGGTQWAKAKDRVTQAVDDLAAEMLRLHALRESMPGTVYPKDTPLQRQFAEEFVYTETEDQLSSIGQVDADMSLPRPMDRLICGDVGYGKTEIAMRAAFKAVEAHRQVAVLVPTTVLADQHFRTFRERFADFPINVDVISRFRTAKQQNEIIKRLQLGQVDILIGTHRLLSRDVKFPDLGLVIIDEEQRFGVASKEHLKSLRTTVDVLTLSATPIPRTLHMALLGLRDISSLQTPPMDRRAIHTEVCMFDETLIRTAINRELNRDGTVRRIIPPTLT
ncbi:MAG TPA: CarD family transcriptional regulator, partial [Phycisphaerae bacterium]|nr:CarD family transcriptional regulator [Phycisphaerae bacterium]